MMISVIRKIPDQSLDTNTSNTTPVKMTGSTILEMCQSSLMVPDGLTIPKIYYISWNSFCKKVINQ